MTELIKYSADLDVEDYYNKYVDVEKYLQYCNECGAQTKNWSCPPFDFDPNDVWKSYKKMKLILYKIEFDEEVLNHDFKENELDFYLMRLFRIKIKLMSEIYNMENENALGLYFSACNLCPRCTREFGMPCKMPHKMRYSIESLGGNVVDMVEEVFDIKPLWIKDGKLPEYLIFVGGLLYNEE